MCSCQPSLLAAAYSLPPSPDLTASPSVLPLLLCRQIKAPQAFSPGEADKGSKRGRPPLPLQQKRREGDGMGGEDDSQQGQAQGQGKRGGKAAAPLDPEEVERRKREKEERVRKRREEVRTLLCPCAVVGCGVVWCGGPAICCMQASCFELVHAACLPACTTATHYLPSRFNSLSGCLWPPTPCSKARRRRRSPGSALCASIPTAAGPSSSAAAARSLFTLSALAPMERWVLWLTGVRAFGRCVCFGFEGPGSREQGAGSREQGAGSRGRRDG